MPRFKIPATIEVEAEITADTAEHARQIIDSMPIEDVAKRWGDLTVHDVEFIPPEDETFRQAWDRTGRAP